MTWEIRLGDALEQLQRIEDASVQTCVTSPPYLGLRDYGTATWEGGDPTCAHKGRQKPRQDTTGSGVNKGRFAESRGTQPGKTAYSVPVRGVCRCGAERFDLQIGLEATVEWYVERLVGVLNEVRRVLTADGTLWLNLGDSYAGSGGTQTAGSSAKSTLTTGSRNGALAPGNTIASFQKPDASGLGLKTKDLVGIPWRVALALQQPYYTGSIRDARDRVWLAAMLDAEGCMFIQRRKAGQHNGQGYYRVNDSYGPGVEIANTSLAVVERIHALVGKGSICSQGPDATGGRRKQTIYRWNLRTIECRDFVRELYPYLVAKQVFFGRTGKG